jgi:hypothetical protein
LAGFQPNVVYTVTIMTDAPYPTGAGADLFTGTSTNGPLVPAGTATGPEAPPLPPPEKPCSCVSLMARIVPSSIEIEPTKQRNGPTTARTPLEIHFALSWALKCSGSSVGSGCEGTLNPSRPTYPYVYRVPPKPHGPITCHAPCAKGATGHQSYEVSGGVTRDRLANETIPIEVKRTCQNKALRSIHLSLAFDSVGRLSLAKSKLG